MIGQCSDRFRCGFALIARRADPTFIPESEHNVVIGAKNTRCALLQCVAGFSADFARLLYRNQPPPGHAQGFHESGL